MSGEESARFAASAPTCRATSAEAGLKPKPVGAFSSSSTPFTPGLKWSSTWKRSSEVRSWNKRDTTASCYSAPTPDRLKECEALVSFEMDLQTSVFRNSWMAFVSFCFVCFFTGLHTLLLSSYSMMTIWVM